MSFDRSFDWAEIIVRILTSEETKVNLSLMESKNVVSLVTEEERVKLLPDSSENVGIVVQGIYQTEVSREKVLSEIIDRIEKRNLIDSKEMKEVLQGKENLFGALVKLTTVLKKNCRVQTVKNQELGVGHFNEGIR